MAKKKTYVANYEGAVDYSKQYVYPGNPRTKPKSPGYYEGKGRVKVKEKSIRNKQRSNRISMGEALGGNRGYPLGVQRKIRDYSQRYRNVKNLQQRSRGDYYAWDMKAPNIKPPLGSDVDSMKYPTMADPWGEVPKSVSMTDIKSWAKPKNKMIGGLGEKAKSFALGTLRNLRTPLGIVGTAAAVGITAQAAKGIQKRKKRAQEAIRQAEEEQQKRRGIFGRKRKERSDKGKKRGKYRT